MLEKYISNGELVINKEDWGMLNEKYDKNTLKEAISSIIENHNLQLPYRSITLKEAKEDFNKLLSLETSSLIKTGTFFTRYGPYNRKFSDIYIENNIIGNKTSDYFFQEMRFNCDSINSPSPHRTWTIKKFRDTMLSTLWGLKFKEVNNNVFRSCIALGKYIASQFRVSAAKTIYDYFKPNSTLDFSSGWGDRLCGFISSQYTQRYIGVDPNSTLIPCYKNLVDIFNTNKSVECICSAAEDIKLNEKVDLVFTSPPYFDIERYSKDSNQSWIKYKKIDVWLEKFLFKAISNAWDCLNKNGFLVINIADVYCHHKVNKICDPMNDYISSLPNSSFYGCWGLRMNKRPQSKQAEALGIFAEPIWIWQKK